MAIREQVQEQVESLLAPISADTPAGTDVSYEPTYEQLRAEIAKLDSPSGGETDWARVESLGREVLGQSSKDLLVAAYTCFAMYQRHGLVGLASGLSTLSGLIDRYWEGLFPPLRRIRGRRNALVWLTERLETPLGSQAIEPADREALAVVKETLQTLVANLRQRFDDEPPSTRALEDALARLELSLPAEAAPASPPSTSEGSPSPPPAPDGPQARPPSHTAATATRSDEASTPPTQAPPASPAPAPDGSQQAQPTDGSAPAASPHGAEASEETEKATASVPSPAAPWLEPISGDQPAGEDARFDPRHEQVRAEIGKLESLSGQVPNWAEIVRLSDELLRETSKDLLIATYLVHGRYQKEGLPWLSTGLTMLAELMERYWDELYPPKRRLRGRANALNWLVERLQDELTTVNPKADDRAAVEAIGDAANKLADVVSEQFAGEGPAMRPLLEATERLMLSVPAPVEKPEPTPTAPASPPPATQSTPPPKPSPQSTPATVDLPTQPTAAPANAEQVTQFLVSAGQSLVKAANLLRNADPSSPLAYRLLRNGLWLHMSAAPPADAGGKTQIPAFPADRRNKLELMVSNGKWPAVLDEAESSLSQFRFCLDLNRYTHQALGQLGHEGAQQMVTVELQALLGRMPELLEYQAADGSPLADEDTLRWIRQDVLTTGSATAASPEEGEAEDAAGKEIERSMRAGKAQEALSKAKTLIAQTGHPRLRFQRRLRLAELCLDHGSAHLARSLFAALDGELRERGLAEWEPSLASTCLQGLVRSIRAAAKAGASPYPGADAAFERLCLVDPQAAARLAP